MYEKVTRSERIRLRIKDLMENKNSSEFAMNLYSSEITWIEKNFESIEVIVTNDCGKLKACKIKKVQ